MVRKIQFKSSSILVNVLHAVQLLKTMKWADVKKIDFIIRKLYICIQINIIYYMKYGWMYFLVLFSVLMING